jgi:hypothetical protein
MEEERFTGDEDGVGGPEDMDSFSIGLLAR